MATDDELSRLAEEALLREAQRGAQRAQISGPSGWLKCRLPSTNKTFLQNTLLGAMASNRAKERQEKSRSERGKRRRQQEEKEKNTYKRIYLHASTKSSKKPSEQRLEDEESQPKKASKEKEQSQVFMWTESGLQLTTNSRKDRESKELSPRENTERGRKVETSVLSRKIKFVPSNSEEDKR